MTATSLAAYLVLFATVAFLFLFVALLLGRLLRARVPTAEKLQPYECGEPPVGSSFVQYDLRFYVVALVFIIFEVEVAFFFPWATVFGKAVELSVAELPAEKVTEHYRRLGVPQSQLEAAASQPDRREKAEWLALASMADIGVFFAVLLVGFAYVWYRGDLNWVRAIGHPPAGPGDRLDQS